MQPRVTSMQPKGTCAGRGRRAAPRRKTAPPPSRHFGTGSTVTLLIDPTLPPAGYP